MSTFILVTTLVVWLCAVLALSLGSGFPYGLGMATLYSLPLLILCAGLYRSTDDKRNRAHPSESQPRAHLGVLLAWIPNVVVLAVADVLAWLYIATSGLRSDGVEIYYLLMFGAWLLCVVTGAIGLALENFRQRPREPNRV